MQQPLSKTTIPQINGHNGLRGTSLDGVEVLMELGLTGRQARVYLALLRCEDAKAKVIADLSVVERQEVYSLIDSLSARGLVKRNISTPTTFIPTPIVEGVKLLLQQKTSQMSTLRQQTKLLIKKYSNPQRVPKTAGVRPCFGVVYEADRARKYLNAIKNSRQTIEAVTSWRRFKQLNIHFESQLQVALKQGVVIRFVTEKPVDHRLPKWMKLALVKYPDFEVKTTPCRPEAVVAVFDRAEAAVAFDPSSSLTKGPDLWTTQSGLVLTCQSFFGIMYERLQK
jgi:sugar-specific transcriptional regulator TrmB